MLTIRLQRVGRKGFPTYRVIISEKTKDTLGDYLELLGNFNPHAKENQLNIKTDRVKYWLSQGAQMSDTVNNLLVSNNIIEAKKRRSVKLSKKRQAKLEEKNKIKAEAEAKAQAEDIAKTEEPTAEATKEVVEEAKESAPVESTSEEPVKAEESAPENSN